MSNYLNLIHMDTNTVTLFKRESKVTIEELKKALLAKKLKNVKGVNLPKDTLEAINKYLSNIAYAKAYNSTMSEGFKNGLITEDEYKAVTGLVSFQLNAFNKPYNNVFTSCYNAYLTEDYASINRMLNALLKTEEYDYMKVINVITTGLNASYNGASIISKSYFIKVIVSAILAIMSKSGNKIFEGQKFEASYDEVVATLITVKKEDTFKDNTYRMIIDKLSLEGDYVKQLATIYKLYETKKVLIINDEGEVVNDTIDFKLGKL